MTTLRHEFQRHAEKAEPKYPPPFSLRLTHEERARLLADAGRKPLSAYIRERLLGENDAPRKRQNNSPIKDHEALGRVLGALGRSRLASNLNQLAKAVNTGSLPVTPETEANLKEACRKCRPSSPAAGSRAKKDRARQRAGAARYSEAARGLVRGPNPTSSPPGSSSSTRPGPRPTWPAPTAAPRAASACASACRMATGRPPPSSPPSRSAAGSRLSSSPGRSTAMPSRPTSRRCSCRSSGPATLSSWTTSRATRGRRSARSSRPRAPQAGGTHILRSVALDCAEGAWATGRRRQAQAEGEGAALSRRNDT